MKTLFRMMSLTIAAATAISAAPPAPKPAWSPNPTLLTQLAPAQQSGPYQIQPPAGYGLQTQPGPGGSLGRAWVSPVRPDGTRCYVMLVTVTPAPGDKKRTLDEAAAEMLKGIQRRRTNWKQSPSETGIIHGIPFIRTYWKGTEPTTGAAMHGFSYVARDGKGFLQLSSQDMEPYSTETLPLMEASILTFKKL